MPALRNLQSKMKPRLLKLSALVLALAAVVPLHAEPVELDPAALPPAWETRFKTLAERRCIAAPFTENRWLPFKKIPVVLTGEMRLAPDHGLSLHYLKPDDRLMVIDAQGILLRDGKGRTRDLGNDPRANAATHLMLDLLRFDLNALHRSFTLVGEQRTDAPWTLTLTPRKNSDLGLQRIHIEGHAARPEKITLIKSSVSSVEILVGEPTESDAFPPEILKKNFR